MTEIITAWHFSNGSMKYGDKTKLIEGETYEAELPLIVAQNGLHGSVRPLDALRYAGGFTCSITEHSGEIIEEADKICSQYRKHIKIFDAREIILRFALYCAKDCLKIFEQQHPEDMRVRECIEATKDFIDKKISAEELRRRRAAAYAAAAAAAYAAAAAAYAAYAAAAADAAAAYAAAAADADAAYAAAAYADAADADAAAEAAKKKSDHYNSVLEKMLLGKFK